MEDYKEKYEHALERAKKLIALPDDKAMLEEIFPELKESEDENIRKELIEFEVKEVDLNAEKCEYLNNDGNCIYALNKTGKVMRCQYINCYRKIKAQKGE
jgi:hypothetical protein